MLTSLYRKHMGPLLPVLQDITMHLHVHQTHHVVP